MIGLDIFQVRDKAEFQLRSWPILRTRSKFDTLQNLLITIDFCHRLKYSEFGKIDASG